MFLKKIIVNKKFFFFIALFIVIVCTLAFMINLYFQHKQFLDEKEAIDYFFEVQKNEKNDVTNLKDFSKSENKKEQSDSKTNYIAVIQIPKINLKKGLVAKNSKYNDVNYNIQILHESTLPNEENSNLILAAHSGNSRIAYFKNLYKLKNEDIIYIFYNHKLYAYTVREVREVEKNGTVSIRENINKTLTLITCKNGTNKQIVITATLSNEEEM